jgi:hypothetical protein
MAFSATTEWDVQTGGSDANGGGFDTASTGTDRSLSTTAFQAYTDIVIDATTNTKITSAAFPFGSTSPGNIINITAGTGFTVQRVQIVSVLAGVATCDKAVGTTSSTGGTGNLGGCLLTLATVMTLVAQGNKIHVKAGTYTLTTPVVIPNGGTTGITLIGYNAAHNDGGTKPLVTTATNSTALFSISLGWIVFRNVSLSNTAGIRFRGIQSTGSFPSLLVQTCLFDGFSIAIAVNNEAGGQVADMGISQTEIKNSTGDAITMNYRTHLHGNYIHDNTGNGITWGGSGQLNATHNVFARNATGISANSGGYGCMVNNAFYKNTANGINTNGTSGWNLTNNIFYGNTTNGIANATLFIQLNNAFGSNGTNRTNSTTLSIQGDVTLTADPFTSSTVFTLNTTSGGGAACAGAGYPGVSPAGTGGMDIGPIQSAAGGGGSTTIYVIAPNQTRFIGEEA